MGYVTRSVPTDHPDFGKAFLCPTCGGGVAVQEARQRRREKTLRLLLDAGLTESRRHDHLGWSDFAEVSEGKKIAVALAEQWATGEAVGYDILGDEHPFAGTYPTLQPFRPSNSLWLHGPYGTGKTGLARLAYRTRVEHTGEVGVFVEWQALYEAIKSHYGKRGDENQSYPLLEAVANAGVLVLDDVGRLRREGPVGEDQYEKLAYIVDTRYKRELPTVITSNLDRHEMRERFDGYIVGRLAEMCVIAEMGGQQYREFDR